MTALNIPVRSTSSKKAAGENGDGYDKRHPPGWRSPRRPRHEAGLDTASAKEPDRETQEPRKPKPKATVT